MPTITSRRSNLRRDAAATEPRPQAVAKPQLPPPDLAATAAVLVPLAYLLATGPALPGLLAVGALVAGAALYLGLRCEFALGSPVDELAAHEARLGRASRRDSSRAR